MRNRFVTQPFEDGFDLRDFLRRMLADPNIKRLDIAVAWVRRSGLRMVEEELRGFRDAGGYVRMIVGISQGGATKQGLELALDLADEVSIFHDPHGRTFHVKVYVAYDSGAAAVFVGSHNFTGGGTVRNYEAGNICELDLAMADDQVYLQSVSDYFDRLLDDEDVCIRLDADLLIRLVGNSSYQILDEDSDAFTSHAGHPTDADAGEPEDVQAETGSDTPMFGRSKRKLRSVPRMIRSDKVGTRAISTTPRVAPTAPQTSPAQAVHVGSAPGGSPAPKSIVVKRWYKELDEANAQRSSGTTTHRTGHLTLTQNSFLIDHKTYFRNDFFARAAWNSTGGSTKESAIVPFEIVVRGQNHGIHQLEVDHNPAHVSAQGNRATSVRWGAYLNPFLRDNDHVGDTVTVELLGNDSYRITIDAMPTGPFIS